MGFAHLLYISAAIIFLFITILFQQTKNGIERKIMIWIFGTTSFGLFIRGFTIILPVDVLLYYNDIIHTIIVTPILISSGIGALLLYNKYYKK